MAGLLRRGRCHASGDPGNRERSSSTGTARPAGCDNGAGARRPTQALLGTALGAAGAGVAAEERRTAIGDALRYLDEFRDDMPWIVVEADPERVLIGFSEPLCDDWRAVLSGAAVKASKAAPGHLVVAIAVPASERDVLGRGKQPDIIEAPRRRVDGRVRSVVPGRKKFSPRD